MLSPVRHCETLGAIAASGVTISGERGVNEKETARKRHSESFRRKDVRISGAGQYSCMFQVRFPRRPSSDAGRTPRNDGIKQLLKAVLGMTALGISWKTSSE